MTPFFTCTSSDLYDRHDYHVVLKDGKILKFSNWQDVQEYWFNHNQLLNYLDVVIVKDKAKVKSKGFAQ